MKKQNIVLVLKIIAGIASACLAVIGAESCDGLADLVPKT